MPDLEVLATNEKAEWELRTGEDLWANTTKDVLEGARAMKEQARQNEQVMQQMLPQVSQLQTANLPDGITDLSQLPPLDLSHLYAGAHLYEVASNRLLYPETQEKGQSETNDLQKKAGNGKAREDRQDKKRSSIDRKKTEIKKEKTSGSRQPEIAVNEQNNLQQNTRENKIHPKQEVTARDVVPAYQDQGQTVYKTRESVRTRSVGSQGSGLGLGSLGKNLGNAAMKKEETSYAAKTLNSIATNITQNTHRTVELSVNSGDKLRFEYDPSDGMTYSLLNGERIGPEQTINLLKEVNQSLGGAGRAIVEAGIRHATMNPAQREPVSREQAITEHNRTVVMQQQQRMEKVKTTPAK